MIFLNLFKNDDNDQLNELKPEDHSSEISLRALFSARVINENVILDLITVIDIDSNLETKQTV